MMHLGDFDASAVIYGKFTTFRPSSGAAFTLAGTPALSVYKDNSTTESTTGVTLTVDFDSRTGLHHFAIDTSQDGTFYSAGSFFNIVITTGTVDGVSVVGAVIGGFTLRKNSALKPTTAGRTLDVSVGGEGGVDWANVGSPTTTVDLSGTTIKTTQKVDVDTIKTNPVVNGGTITFPTNSTIASTTNITAGTITTTTNLTNAPPDSSGVTTLLSRLSADRATLLDNLSNLDAAISSIASAVAGVAAAAATAVWAAASRTLTAFGFSVTVGTNNDKTGYSLAAGQLFVKKNTQLTAFTFPMFDDTDHQLVTGKTVSVKLSKDGGAFAASSNAVTEISDGFYKITLTATEMNATIIAFKATATDCDDAAYTFTTQA